MDGKLTNDYNDDHNIGKGIKFGKNADGSFFTLRPYLPDNVLQVTKNDSIRLFDIDTSGNGFLGTNQIITSGNIGSQSVNYAHSAGGANAATKAYQDGNGADIASTYLKGTQNNGDFINRPSVNIGGTICGLIPTYKQNSQGYPVVGLYIQPGTERLIIDWYADGNIIKSYITTGRV
nr:MAG TPA: hypothetical protein [Caudoviricetes sp.]